MTSISVGHDKGWSQNLLSALEQIDSRYIMYFQEDYWINAPVNTSAIIDYVAAMDKWGINYIRLLAFPKPDRDFAGDQRLGIIDTQAAYRTAVQISLWRKSVLQELIDPSETAWEFEVRGTERSRKYGESFLSIKEYFDDPYYYGLRYVCTAINQGRWSRAAREYAEREGIEVDFGNLPTETWWHEFQRKRGIGAFTRIAVHRANLVLRHPGTAYRKIRRRISG